jgi:hypothetical protein
MLYASQAPEVLEGVLRDCLSEKRPETHALEYKAFRAVPGLDLREIAKDVLAMANAQGGDLFVGIDEAADGGGRPGDLSGATAADLSRFLDTLQRLLADTTEPSVPDVEYAIITGAAVGAGPDVAVLALHVSVRDAPYALLSGERRVYHVRDGTSSRPMAHAEIRDAFLQDRLLMGLARLEDMVAARPQAEPLPLPVPRSETLAGLRDAVEDRWGSMAGTRLYVGMLTAPDPLPSPEPFAPEAIGALFEALPPVRMTSDWSLHLLLGRAAAAPTGSGMVWTVPSGNLEWAAMNEGAIACFALFDRSIFEWNRPEAVTSWLYPYALCDAVVSFAAVAERLLGTRGLLPSGGLTVRLGNARGALLPGGHHDSPMFMRNVLAADPKFPEESLTITERWPSGAAAVDVAYGAVRQIYRSFAHEERAIPPGLFDQYRMALSAWPSMSP